ncbi:TPA: hypothetical protein ENS27_18745 [bacterium]|nr:hypothetical protein [bacterium]
MKKLSIVLYILFIFILSTTIMADSKEGKGSYNETGYIAPSKKFTQLNGELGTILGLSVGWISEHSFIVEGSFFGLINEVSSPRPGSELGVGYSGLSLGYNIPLGQKVHILINTMFGVGRVSYKRDYSQPKNPDKDKLSSIIAVVEPGLNLEINITDYFRLSLGASYRVVDRVDLKNLSNDDINGITGNIALKFGAF